MASFNSVTLVGNLTRDPELRHIPSGVAVCEIGLAVNERVKKDGEWTEAVNFFDVVIWGRTAEVANEYLRKGSPVLIAGRLKQESWEKDGEKRYKIKVVCETMQMLGGKGGDGGQRESRPEPQQQRAPEPQRQPARSHSDEEIPF